jgi:Killing trait
MAYPTPVNGQITDSVTQSNVSVVAQAPAMAMGMIYQSAAHSIGILYQNATQAQQQASMCAQAATNQGVIQLYSAGTMAGAAATAKLARQGGGGGVSGTDLALALILLKYLR